MADQSDAKGANVAEQPSIAEHHTGVQLTIAHLLYLTTWLAAAIAMFESHAPVWLLSVVGFWLLVFVLRNTDDSMKTFVTLIFLAILLFLFWALLPSVQRVREASRRTQCINNTRQLWLAMQNYMSARLRLPPAYRADENGKPIHSWRVLILPEIEHQAIYDQYDFSEPWDGPNNSKLKKKIGYGPYFCPMAQSNDFKTPYKLVTGKGTAFDGDKSTTGAQFKSTANTIAIIEDPGNPVCWMEPKDLTIEEAVKLFDFESATTTHGVIQTKFSRRVYYHQTIAMLDGSVRSVGYLKDPRQIIPYLMLDHPAKKDLSELDFDYPEPQFQVLYSGYLLLAFNIFLAVLPCYWKRLQPFADP